MQDLDNMISEYRRKHLWGKIELHFRAGELTFIKREETYAPVEKNSRTVPRNLDGVNDSEPARI
jgi:hypothetical protein